MQTYPKDYQNNKNENPVATFSNTSSQATTNNNTRTRTLANKIRIAAFAVAEDNSKIIDADALANGYIKVKLMLLMRLILYQDVLG